MEIKIAVAKVDLLLKKKKSILVLWQMAQNSTLFCFHEIPIVIRVYKNFFTNNDSLVEKFECDHSPSPTKQQ